MSRSRRVKALLTKLDSDRRAGTDYFGHKFMAKVSEIFAGLPKPKDVRSFEGNDLPLLFTTALGSGLSRFAHVTGHKKPAQGGILAPGTNRLVTD